MQGTVKSNSPDLHLILAITGASGAIYSKSLIQIMAENVYGKSELIISPNGLRVYREEQKSKVSDAPEYLREILAPINDIEKAATIHHFVHRDYQNIGDHPASGSTTFDGMVIVPCSMKTLAAISTGYSDNLITRAADVCLKEKRKLILVLRETPFSPIHLENMLRLARYGAVILPANPGFYHNPQTIKELADFISHRILRQFGVSLGKIWAGSND